ncbi:hypothetical protein BV501_08130 [Erwinia sp. OAMSP11]|nr:hypothetical protein BV501_08130 [Erwinia sp. OAMSP11]
MKQYVSNCCFSVFLPAGLCLLAGGLFCRPVAAQFPADKGIRYFPVLIHYDAAKEKAGSVVNAVNNTDKNYLLQATVSAFDPASGRTDAAAGGRPPFVVVPPLTRLDAGERIALRVRQAGGTLPSDRESACIISVTGIPPLSQPAPDARLPQAGRSQVQIALRMNIRLFYRPPGLPAPDSAAVAASLKFQTQSHELTVVNPTPYFVHFSSLSVGGAQAVSGALDAWVAPKSNQRFRFSAPLSGAVLWKMNGEKNEYKATL